jgi:XTP/dITP diphosphohydrolase
MADSILFLATRNRGKIEELRAMLADVSDLRILAAPDFPDISEPDETGDTFMDNARAKALYYSQKSGYPALADDSGLVIDALDGRPGVHSARYAETEELRIQRVLGELSGVPTDQRTARFVCAAVLASGAEIAGTAEAYFEGRIGFRPRGTNGFGYDPIFLPGTGSRTLAEFSAEEKNAASHRAKALSQLLPVIRHLLIGSRSSDS